LRTISGGIIRGLTGCAAELVQLLLLGYQRSVRTSGLYKIMLFLLRANICHLILDPMKRARLKAYRLVLGVALLLCRAKKIQSLMAFSQIWLTDRRTHCDG
jgi:hypothetical protein